jgi:hypothetical protein
MRMVVTQWWILERDVGAAYFRLRRTPEPTISLDRFSEVAEAFERALAGVDRSRLGLLVDLRDGPMRNDAVFERTAAPYQARMVAGFRRVAVLVKTPAGKLQMRRLAEGALHEMPGIHVFDEEPAALAFLTARS